MEIVSSFIILVINWKTVFKKIAVIQHKHTPIRVLPWYNHLFSTPQKQQ